LNNQKNLSGYETSSPALHETGAYVIPYGDEIDLREYIEILWKWRFTIISITLLAVITAGIFSFFVLKPVYEASVQIMVSADSVPNDVIKSPYFLKTVVEKLDLPDDPKYTPFNLAKAMQVQTGKTSNLAVIKFEDSDPALASQLVNAIAQQYVEFVQEKNRETADATVLYLQTQRLETEEALSTAKTELQNLQQEGKIEALQREVNRLASKVSEYKSILASGEVREQELKKGIEELEKLLATTEKMVPGPLDYAGRPTEVPNETYQRFEQSLAFKKIELKELEVRLSEVRSKLPVVEEEYSANYEALLSLQRQVQDLEMQVSRLSSKVSALDAKIIQVSTAMPETTIAAPALIPQEPVKPRKLLNMAVAGVLGGFVSVFMVFFIEYWRSPRKENIKYQADQT